jgi:putative membrane protein
LDLTLLPSLNAGLNAATTICLVTGWLLIRRRRIAAHRLAMLMACLLSVLFLVSYLYYHSQIGSKRFEGTGSVRPVYFTILLTHTVLAAAIVPLVLVTLWRALRKRFDRHRAIARWTLPIWLYVSVTGVIVYWMLYRMTW